MNFIKEILGISFSVNVSSFPFSMQLHYSHRQVENINLQILTIKSHILQILSGKVLTKTNRTLQSVYNVFQVFQSFLVINIFSRFWLWLIIYTVNTEGVAVYGTARDS